MNPVPTLESAPSRRPAPGDEVTLLGVRFDRLTRGQALSAMEEAFGRGEARKIFMPTR